MLEMGPDSHRAQLRAEVWKRLEAQQEALVDLCQALIRTPSVNGVHLEAEVAGIVEAALKERGIDVQMPEYATGRPNVLATVGGGDPGLLLVGHLDTVPAGAVNSWTHDPFAATIDGGRIFGRGACDNKAGIAIGVVLLGVFQTIEAELQGCLTLCCVPDEESGATGRLGIKPLLRDGYLWARQAIYTYPGLDLLCIGHRGLLRVKIEASGEATHTGGEAWEFGEAGANAVTAMAELLLALEEWQPAFEKHAAFPGRRPVVTPGTRFAGGDIESMVPAHAQAMVDVRLLPGQHSDALLVEMQQMGRAVASERPGVQFTWHKTIDLPAVSIAADHPVVVRLAHWTEKLAGRRPQIAGAGPANEGYLLIGAGIPTVCGFGPPGGNAHAADEFVEIDGLLQTAKIYAAAALDLLLPDSDNSLE